jgi:hypothetical protein
MRSFAFVALCAAGVAASTEAQVNAPPAWMQHEMESLTRDGGRWITDNAAYRGPDEPHDAYGLEWSWGIGRKTVRGRLFGLQGGRDVGTFWEFRMVWHPGRREVLLYQFGGDGTLGVGPMIALADGRTEAVQTFYAPDGTVARVRHLTRTDGDTHETSSFDEDGSGWKPRRTYVWRRETEGGR